MVDAYLAVWESYGVPAEHFSGDKRASVREFLAISRNQYEGGVVIAGHDAIIVGSVGYQVQVPQFPEVLRRDIRKVGYLWTVYVEPEARGHGIATAMVSRTVEQLRAIGCTMVVLHASDAGAPLYSRLGFAFAKEMRLSLRQVASR